jgi:hypothetical protein
MTENSNNSGRPIKNLVITSSGFVNPNLYGDLGKILTSHIPISGKFALMNILKLAEIKYENIFITIDENVPKFIDVLRLSTKANVIVGNSRINLDSNIKIIFENLPTDIGSLEIIFGDTLNTDLLIDDNRNDDAIYVSDLVNSTQFTSISRDIKTGILNIMDQNFVNTNLKVTGSFKISNLLRFKQIFVENLALNKDNSFWNTWIKYDQELNHEVSLIIDSNWADVGHIDNYFGARKNSIIGASRHFNTVIIDPESFWVRKSGPIDKIELEKKWFSTLPVNLNKYLPAYKLTEIPGTYEIEYLTSIPTNEMWISENDDSSYWIGFAEQMENLLRDMHERKMLDSKEKLQIKHLKKIVYIDKFHERIDKFLKINPRIFEGNLTVNDQSAPNLHFILQCINEVSEKIIELDSWSVIHGDLCFSNIIFDRRKDKLNMIDPRGSFGAEGIYGDPIYDLAKLSHSINGNYDYFTSDLFHFSHLSNTFELKTSSPVRTLISREICKEFLDLALKNYRITKEDLRMIEAGLFMSAAALHPEKNRGLALFLNGMVIAKEVLS